jgi:hypothetical protein
MQFDRYIGQTPIKNLRSWPKPDRSVDRVEGIIIETCNIVPV